MEKIGTKAKASGTTVGFVSILVIVLLSVVYLNFAATGGAPSTQYSSVTTTNSGIRGVVTGYVTVGPSQPVCYANQTCNVNVSGYSLVFTAQCPGSSTNCQTSMAELSPSGHYSIFLPAGNYTITGLYPSCNWVGCSSAFPKIVVVQGGMQLVFNVNIDTGIR